LRSLLISCHKYKILAGVIVRLTDIEQLILLAVVRLGPEAYGVGIQREIEERTGQDLQFGSIYRALRRLEEQRLVIGTLGEPTSDRGGRRKKHFRLTAAGERALRRSIDGLQAMADGVALRGLGRP
jgi:DNA-binding PadR family transcriptional regulator